MLTMLACLGIGFKLVSDMSAYQPYHYYHHYPPPPPAPAPAPAPAKPAPAKPAGGEAPQAA